MTLMANRPKLSLKRAREIRQRNASVTCGRAARAFLDFRRYHRTQRGTRAVQRIYRGHMARKRAGPRLAEIRARHKAEEEAKAAEREAARKAKEKEEMERIKEMARVGGTAVRAAVRAAGWDEGWGVGGEGEEMERINEAARVGGTVVFISQDRCQVPTSPTSHLLRAPSRVHVHRCSPLRQPPSTTPSPRPPRAAPSAAVRRARWVVRGWC